MLIEFQLSGCNGTCQLFFELRVWETSSMNDTQARNLNNYRLVRRVAPNIDATQMLVNESVDLTFQTNAAGFFIAVVDMNTCIAITRLIVLYHVCPEIVQDLIKYPMVVAPQSGLQSVAGECVEGASGEIQGMNPTLFCLPVGVWASVQPGTGCQCHTGFFRPGGMEICQSKFHYFMSYKHFFKVHFSFRSSLCHLITFKIPIRQHELIN